MQLKVSIILFAVIALALTVGLALVNGIMVLTGF